MSTKHERLNAPYVIHTRRQIDFDLLTGKLDDVIANLLEINNHLSNANLVFEQDYEYPNLYLNWDIPMNETQVVQEDKRRANHEIELDKTRVRSAALRNVKKIKSNAKVMLETLEKYPDLLEEVLKEGLSKIK